MDLSEHVARLEPAEGDASLLPFVAARRGEAQSDLFRQLLEAAPDAVIVVDKAGQMLFANNQAEKLFGYRRHALLGQNVDLLVPERLRADHAVHRERYASAPRLRPMGSGIELFGRRQDGSEFPVEISLSPLRVADATLFSANVRDISARRREEREMQRVQGQLLSAVESIQGGFALFDSNDRLVLCNSNYRQIVGPSLEGEVVGRTFAELLAASLESGVFQTAEQLAGELRGRWTAQHRGATGALDVRTAGGQVLRIVERPTADGGVVATIWDVSEEVNHEGELSQARALAEAASAAKTEFLASMSHELRTPLNAILGFAQLLQRDKKSPLSARQHERVDHVLKGGEHLLRLIDDVLDLARIEAGRVLISTEPVKVAEVLEEVKSTLDPMAARAGIRLSIGAVPVNVDEVVADRTRFKQILMNYGSNAIKYGRNGGSARFETEHSSGAVRITVIDDGFGVPRAKHEILFQPFQRAGQETGPIEGTGIGLVITKRLAELMKGRVGFDSTEGLGSRFWLELPLHHAAPTRGAAERPQLAPDASSALAGEQGPRYVIVYVEDNPSNIAFMEDLLADFERVELVPAPTAEIGIELIRSRRPDVVIMDINLPGMSGLEAARKLRGWPETSQIPVIALSAAATIRDAARVVGAGFYRYLTKPVRVDELTAVLEGLLAQRPGTPLRP